MFKRARLELTAWYVLIIMLMSFTFSAFIYNEVSREFKNRLITIENRLSKETPQYFRIEGPVHEYFRSDLESARNRIFLILIYANGFLFVLSSMLGHYLAGKTLEPIEHTMDEQKRFVADASHELKTPITALKTSIEVSLRDKKLNLKEAKRTLQESLDDIDDLKILTNELLALARIEEANLKKQRVNTKEVIRREVEKFEKQAKAKNIKIANKLSLVYIKADEEKIAKLISILLDNAIKYTPKGGKVSIISKLSKNLRVLLIIVKDTGIGIAEKHLEKIFERFYRVESSRSKIKAEGFGLGLSLAKIIVEKHEGKIEVESKIGKGSIFTVKMPI
ncbi:HAMP domain-containing histidine kinase [Candidatus Woesebacteria bacterium]|nr:HAMP domain-containing histidine kinase [Candidatus Woesebacteria bacterium]